MRLKNTQLVLVGFVAFLVVVGLLDGFRMAHFALFFIHGPYRGYLFTKCWFGGCNNREITDHVQADVEYRLRGYENRYANPNRNCPISNEEIGNAAWVTAMVNDQSVMIATVLGYTLDLYTCFPRKIALISDDLSEWAKEQLLKVGWELRVVQRLDCGTWTEAKIERLPGAATKLQAWNMTDLDHVVYLDIDIMLLGNIDELLLPLQDPNQYLGATYCTHTEEWLTIGMGCLQSGLLRVRPNAKVFTDMLAEYERTVKKYEGLICIEDHVFLFHFFGQDGAWEPSSMAYNARKWSAVGRTRPMRLFHFALCDKPWVIPESCKNIGDRPVETDSDVRCLWLHYYNSAVQLYNLDLPVWVDNPVDGASLSYTPPWFSKGHPEQCRKL